VRITSCTSRLVSEDISAQKNGLLASGKCPEQSPRMCHVHRRQIGLIERTFVSRARCFFRPGPPKKDMNCVFEEFLPLLPGQLVAPLPELCGQAAALTDFREVDLLLERFSRTLLRKVTKFSVCFPFVNSSANAANRNTSSKFHARFQRRVLRRVLSHPAAVRKISRVSIGSGLTERTTQAKERQTPGCKTGQATHSIIDITDDFNL
jgi:hypothetical protein